MKKRLTITATVLAVTLFGTATGFATWSNDVPLLNFLGTDVVTTADESSENMTVLQNDNAREAFEFSGNDVVVYEDEDAIDAENLTIIQKK